MIRISWDDSPNGPNAAMFLKLRIETDSKLQAVWSCEDPELDHQLAKALLFVMDYAILFWRGPVLLLVGGRKPG